MDLRDQRAIRIAAFSRIDRKDGVWLVPSETTPGLKYEVVLEGEGRCNCPDCKAGFRCKHIRALRITLRRELGMNMDGTITETRSITVQERLRPRDHAAETEAKAVEGHRVKQLLFELLRGVKEPERIQRGRKPHDIKDVLFSMVLKVYRKFSSRRITADLLDAHQQGYLTKPIPKMKVCAFFERPDLSPTLASLVCLSAGPLRSMESVFAVDSTNFPNTKTENWYNHKTGKAGRHTIWTKAHAACGTLTHIVAAVRVSPDHDSQEFDTLIKRVAMQFPLLKEVCADSAYLSGDIVDQVFNLGALPFIMPKSNTTGGIGGWFERMILKYKDNPEDFLKHYHQRSNAETVFSMVKATTGEPVWSKSPVAMKNEVFCKFIAHNLCVVNQEEIESGVKPDFWGDGKRVVPVAHRQPLAATGTGG